MPGSTAPGPGAPGARGRVGAWAALGVVWVVWGAAYLGNRLVVGEVPPLLGTAARFAVAALLLGAGVLVVRGPRAFRADRAQLGGAALVGLLMPAWGNGLLAVGQLQVASGPAALLFAAVPIWIVALRLLSEDRPRPATVLAAGVGMVGLVALVLAGTPPGALGGAWWGPVLVLVAGMGWAAGTFTAARLPSPPDALAATAVQTLVGAVLLTGAGLAAGERLDLAAIGPVAWGAWAYLAVVVSCVGFSALTYAVRRLPISTVSTYAYVNPVIAVGLGAVVVGERLAPVQLAGGVVVLAAVGLTVAAERRPKPSVPGDSIAG